MAALGRILGILGIVWIAVALFGNAFDLPDLNIFPGIIMLFIARGLSRQARRSEGSGTVEEPEPEEVPRMLNTERRPRPDPKPAPKAPPPAPSERVRNPEPSPKSEKEKDEMLEQILLAGTEAVEEGSIEPEELVKDLESFQSGRPLSSEELIAQARRRWDRRDS